MGKQTKDPRRETSPFAALDRAPSSALIEKLLRSAAWPPDAALDENTLETFCDRLKESARFLSHLPETANPADRAESFRYLLTMIAYAVDASLLNADPLEPLWSQPYRLHLLDWGGASPDGVYRRVMVRDDLRYRVHGRIGNGKYFSLDFRQSSPACTVMRDDLEIDGEGAFELFLGGAPREKNWRPLHKGTTGLVVRELFDDWRAARRSHLRIECLDGATAPRPEYCAGRVAAEFDLIGDWILEGAVRYWAEQSAAIAAKMKNAFLPKLHRADTKLPATTFARWDLAPDEALIIEFADPDAEFWGMHLTTSLWRTLDYANRLTTFNLAQARKDADGAYRFVLSSEDPGFYNWLDTTGLRCGVVILRLCKAAHAAPPSTRRVRLSRLGDNLPGAPICAPDERRAQIAERREGVAHMVCD
jgi:hypothetical protein